MTILDVLDIPPGWAWALCCVGLAAGWGMTSVQKEHMELKLATELSNTRVEYAGYKEDAERKAREAEVARRDAEIHNFRNAERTASEQAKRDEQYAVALRRLRDDDQRLRDADEAKRAAIQRAAAAGDSAALAAEASSGDELYRSCREEYRSLGAEAERVRIQALGLREYIRGNSMCSTPFDAGVPEPAK